jgi:PPK2 family polyphosphate:nucleotide phosphotransferase
VFAKIIKPGSDVRLGRMATRAPAGITKDDGRAQFAKLALELGELQELLFAAGTQGLLVIFQGMDTSGKDGGIQDVFSEVNPAGCRIAPFKVPSATELAHDFLWRVHEQTPERGQIVVFNRSHYEDVLVVRVHELAPKSVWSHRFEQINAFERHLTDNNTIVLKFFLHISKDEQEERLLAREADPLKSWKLSIGDWQEREHWADYQRAYADALAKCSTGYAPWHLIPADQKWFRNLAITETIVKTLRPYQDDWKRRLSERSKVQLAALAEARLSGAIPQPALVAETSKIETIDINNQ